MRSQNVNKPIERSESSRRVVANCEECCVAGGGVFPLVLVTICLLGSACALVANVKTTRWTTTTTKLTIFSFQHWLESNLWCAH